MHSECSSPPTANYNNIANNNGQQDGCYPNGSYVLGKNNNSSSPPGSHLHDQDISHIVDQVLSCIGKKHLKIGVIKNSQIEYYYLLLIIFVLFLFRPI